MIKLTKSEMIEIIKKQSFTKMDLASKFNKKKKLRAHGRNKQKADIPSNIIIVNDIQKNIG